LSGATESIRVSNENHRKLVALAGELQKKREERVTVDEAITHLFENQKKEEDK
jgi:predicted transcriptional regulator